MSIITEPVRRIKQQVAKLTESVLISARNARIKKFRVLIINDPVAKISQESDGPSIIDAVVASNPCGKRAPSRERHPPIASFVSKDSAKPSRSRPYRKRRTWSATFPAESSRKEHGNASRWRRRRINSALSLLTTSFRLKSGTTFAGAVRAWPIVTRLLAVPSAATRTNGSRGNLV